MRGGHLCLPFKQRFVQAFVSRNEMFIAALQVLQLLKCHLTFTKGQKKMKRCQIHTVLFHKSNHVRPSIVDKRSAHDVLTSHIFGSICQHIADNHLQIEEVSKHRSNSKGCSIDQYPLVVFLSLLMNVVIYVKSHARADCRPNDKFYKFPAIAPD